MDFRARATIWYSRGGWFNKGGGIWKSRVDGSGETQVISGPVEQFFSATHDGIYYFTPGNHPDLRFFAFAAGKSRTILTLSKPIRVGLDVSPDGRWLLYSQRDTEPGSELMLVDRFR